MDQEVVQNFKWFINQCYSAYLYVKALSLFQEIYVHCSCKTLACKIIPYM